MDNIKICDTNLSVRVKNTCRRMNIDTVGKLRELSEEDIDNIYGLGALSKKEISDFITRIDNGGTVETEVPEVYEIDRLQLSVRSYNALVKAGITTNKQFFALTRDDLEQIRSLGQKSINEILTKIQDNCDPEIIKQDDDKNRLLVEFFKLHDSDLESLHFSLRTENALRNAGIVKLSQIIAMDWYKMQDIRNLGAKSLDELKERSEAIKKPIINDIDKGVLTWDNIGQKTIKETARLIDNMLTTSTEPLTLGRICDELPDVAPAKIKKILDKLVEVKRVIVSESGYELRAPSVMEVISEIDNPKHRYIIEERMKGRTVSDLGDELDVSRQRVAQLQDKAHRELISKLVKNHSVKRFKEDRYRGLFSRYDIEKKTWIDVLGIDINAYMYLSMEEKRGKHTLEEMIDDSNVPSEIRYRVSNYLNKDYIIDDNVRIRKVKSNIERHVAYLFAQDVMKYEDFVGVYNRYLKDKLGITDNSLYITPELKRSRGAIIADSYYVLWKTGKLMRYYDILSNDYDELFDALNLTQYHNIEFSTELLMTMHPEIMEIYDIRDAGELHNLLKKLYDKGLLNAPDLAFGRTPMLKFGEFSRDVAVQELLEVLAPIEKEALIDELNEMYGVEKQTIAANWLKSIEPCCYNGIYTLNNNEIPNTHLKILKEVLTEDFYNITEIQDIYAHNVPDYNYTFINRYSMAQIGFNMYSSYAVKGTTAVKYFRSLFLRNEIVDGRNFSKKYGRIPLFYNIKTELKEDYTIIEIEHGKYITSAKAFEGVDRDQLITEFANQVFDDNPDSIFTIQKLRANGLTTKLDILGHGDWFLGSILREDPRFQYVVLGKGENGVQILLSTKKEKVMYKSLFEVIVDEHGIISLADFTQIALEEYGIDINIGHFSLSDMLEESTVYFDTIEQMLYPSYQEYCNSHK